MAINFPASLDSFATAVDNTTDVMAVDINDMRRAVEVLEAKVGITSSAVDTSIDYKVNNFFVENVRKVLLYENTAPTGWTIQNTLDDKVVAVTKGSVAGGQTGGGVHGTGTWAIAGITNSSESSHTHSGTTNENSYIGGTPIANGGDWLITHTHTFTTGAGGSHTHTISSNSTWRPAAYCCIIAMYTGA